MIKKCNSNGIQIAYQDRGQGEVLVLLMGLGASSLKWEPHIREYEKHFRIIAVDNRGAGQSDKPEMESYSIQSMAEDVIAVLDAENIVRAHVNGISMGGAVAQYLAAHYPDRIISVVLTNTFPRCNVSFRRSIEFLRNASGQLDGKTFGRIVQWIIYAFDFQDHHEDFMLDAEVNDADAGNPIPDYAYKAQCNAILSFDESVNLKNIKAPTLVVAGDSDLFVPVSLSRELAGAIPGAELMMVKNGGHVQHWEQLDNYNQKTLEFLLRHVERNVIT